MEEENSNWIYYVVSSQILTSQLARLFLSCKNRLRKGVCVWVPECVYVYTSVFQPGFRGTQRFRQFLSVFPENAKNSTKLNIQVPPSDKKFSRGSANWRRLKNTGLYYVRMRVIVWVCVSPSVRLYVCVCVCVCE